MGCETSKNHQLGTSTVRRLDVEGALTGKCFATTPPLVTFHRLSGSGGKMTMTYFALWAKGPPIALALEFSGAEWEGGSDYGTDEHCMALYGTKWTNEDKLTNTFGHLPTLEVPGVGVINHEQACLAFIARAYPKMAGETWQDIATSEQVRGVVLSKQIDYIKSCL